MAFFILNIEKNNINLNTKNKIKIEMKYTKLLKT